MQGIIISSVDHFDVVLPGMTGRELADRLKQQRPGMKVVFMSGYIQNVTADHGVWELEDVPNSFCFSAQWGNIRM